MAADVLAYMEKQFEVRLGLIETTLKQCIEKFCFSCYISVTDIGGEKNL